MHSYRSNPPSRAIPPQPAVTAERVVVLNRAQENRERGRQIATPRASIVAALDLQLVERGVAPSAAGRAISNSPGLIAALRAGRVPGPALVAKIEAYLRSAETINA